MINNNNNNNNDQLDQPVITRITSPHLHSDKKLSYRRGTARWVVSVEILPIATQQCRNYLYDKIVL